MLNIIDEKITSPVRQILGKAELLSSSAEAAYGKYVTFNNVIPTEKVKVKVASKNLLDLTSIMGTSVTANGGTLSCGADGGITGSGTATGYVSFTQFRLDCPSGLYTLSASSLAFLGK